MSEPIAAMEHKGHKVLINTSGYFSVDMGDDGNHAAPTFREIAEFIDKQMNLRAKTTKLSLDVIGIDDGVIRKGVLTGVNRTTRKLVIGGKAELGLVMAHTPENAAILRRFLAAEAERKAAMADVQSRLIKTGSDYGRIDAEDYERVLKGVEQSYKISAAPVQEKAGG